MIEQSLLFVPHGSLLDWLIRSEGVFLYPQALLVLLTLTLVLSAIDMTRARLYMPRRLLGHVDRRLANGEIDAAKEALGRSTSALARAVWNSVLLAGGSWPHAVEALEAAADDLAIAAERRLGHVATLAHVSMMVGLLGTVCGLVASFTVISQGSEAPPPNELARGVSMALATTIVGLGTAIPALLVHGYLRSANNRLLFEFQQRAVRWARQILEAPATEASSATHPVSRPSE